MSKLYVLFLCFTILLTIFVSVFQNESFSTKLFTGMFTWPVPPYYGISSYFGYRESPTQNASSYHQGIDILAPCR